MTEANYAELDGTGVKTNDLNKYMEKLTYCVRGNIKTLQRKGPIDASCTVGFIDNMTYDYSGYGDLTYFPTNKLQKVTDASDLTRGFKTVANSSTYTYDNDGNLISDPNKGITSIVIGLSNSIYLIISIKVIYKYFISIN